MYRETVVQSEPVDIAAGDHIFALRIQGLYVGGAGEIVGRLRGDLHDTTWIAVAGGRVPGAFTVIRDAAGGTTASGIVGLANPGSQ